MTKKIIFCLRRDYQKIPAGDIVQMEQWKRVLSQLNCDVTIFSGDIREEDMLDADIVFIWHLERLHESLPFWKIAKKLDKEIWLVPTCWQNNSNLSPLKNIIEETKLFLRRILFPRSFSCGEKFSGWAERRKRLLHESSLLLVNSAAEKQFLLAQGADETKVIVIPNTINAVELEKIPQLPPEKRSGIIHVGHFCPRKNQLKLIKQLKNSGIAVTFIGTARPMHKLYYALCRKLARNQHNFAGTLPHSEVLKLMGKSRLCISSSTSETPGLSNLEAAVLGCDLLLPDIAPVKEYFGPQVTYAPVCDITAEMLQKIFDTPSSDTIRARILANYTEKQTAELFQNLLNAMRCSR